jgi:hypothetical protein
MPVSLGTLTFDDDLLVKQLRGDMKDDWFTDPLLFKDMLNSGLLSKIISTNYSGNNGQYRASSRTLYNIPKPNFTLRYALETGLSDRFLYHALVLTCPDFSSIHNWSLCWVDGYGWRRASLNSIGVR